MQRTRVHPRQRNNNFGLLPLPFLVLAALASCGDDPLPSDDALDEWCPMDPTVQWCPSGSCDDEYQCITYCVRHHPDETTFPDSGLGSWCDDSRMPSYADFCSDHMNLEDCSAWCAANPGVCPEGADGDSDSDGDGDGDVDPVCGDGLCNGDENAENCPDDCPTACGDGVVTGDEICESPETVPCTTACGSDGVRECVDCDWAESCTPPEETCNGEDDDCDGERDNGFECYVGEEGPCTTSCGSEGIATCEATVCTWSDYCEPPEEVCDGIDNNCDDETDEGCDCADGWIELELPYEEDENEYYLSDIWGTAWNDVYALTGTYSIDSPTIFHYNGEEWSVAYRPPQNPRSIYGLAWNDVYVVGSNGMIIHYNGTSWEEVESPTTEHLNSIYGIDSGEYFAVGNNGTIVYYEGRIWDDWEHFTDINFNAIGGTFLYNMYIAGEGTILHFNGEGWLEIASYEDTQFTDIHAISDTDVLFSTIVVDGVNGIYRYNGTEFSLISDFPTFGVYAFSEDRIFAAGVDFPDAIVRVYDGTDWSVSLESEELGFLDVWGSSPNNVYAIGVENIFHRCGDGW